MKKTLLALALFATAPAMAGLDLPETGINIDHGLVNELNKSFSAMAGVRVDDVTMLDSVVALHFDSKLSINYAYSVDYASDDLDMVAFKDLMSEQLESMVTGVCDPSAKLAKAIIIFDNVEDVRLNFAYTLTDYKRVELDYTCMEVWGE
ncbi:hypothetical protein [Vibrio sp. WXL210]|uniref:hypothetical protein n=1 Tax=Vibrio sp. WXL210 TaxID=3450709 RepID=UPI003EC70F65